MNERQSSTARSPVWGPPRAGGGERRQFTFNFEHLLEMFRNSFAFFRNSVDLARHYIHDYVTYIMKEETSAKQMNK